jgi:hypothetical protein
MAVPLPIPIIWTVNQYIRKTSRKTSAKLVDHHRKGRYHRIYPTVHGSQSATNSRTDILWIPIFSWEISCPRE